MEDIGYVKRMGMSKEMSMNGRGGHLYMQTNEVKNAIKGFQTTEDEAGSAICCVLSRRTSGA